MTDFVEKSNKQFQQPHPFRDELKRHGFKQAAVANFLKIHPAYLAAILTGNTRMSPRIESDLIMLIDRAEREEATEDAA